MTEIPIACSLDARDLSTRLAEIADLGRAALIEARRDGARAELRFAARDGVRERVEAIIAAEAECCAFLAMRVSAAPGAIVLAIDAPDDAEVVVQGLVDAFDGKPLAAA